MGMPQFMPDSFRSYAVDFDGDGHRDIWHSPDDVIGSVANYFAKKGAWTAGAAVAQPLAGMDSVPQALVDAGAKPSLEAGQLTAAGIALDPPPAPGTRLSLLEFDTNDGKEYWVGMNNFYSIMRYNPRTKYAMAVYQLSEAIREQYYAQASGAHVAG
jgi:membrane-bound lytic murein transglycosylase B